MITFAYIFISTLQVTPAEDDTTSAVLNKDCKNVSSPEMCPNTWMYVDENYEWKVDTELSIACGKF